VGIGFVLHKKSWPEARGERREDRKWKTEDGFSATLRLAVWGVWAVGGRAEGRRWICSAPGYGVCWDFHGDDDFNLLIRLLTDCSLFQHQ